MNRENSVWLLLIYVVYPILFFWGIYIILCTATPAGTHLLWKITTRRLDAPDAAVFAAILAAAGWMTTALISRMNSVKQHTMQVLTQARLSPVLNEKSKLLFDTYPPGTDIPMSHLDHAAMRADWYRAATYMLNYYEFLSVAIRFHDLHEPLLRDCIRSQLCAYTHKLRHLIAFSRQNDPRVLAQEITADESRIYQDLLALSAAWQKPPRLDIVGRALLRNP